MHHWVLRCLCFCGGPRLYYQVYATLPEDVVYASLLPLGANHLVVDFVPCDGKVRPCGHTHGCFGD